jgi:predicted alpha/beta hydrolase family esterase
MEKPKILFIQGGGEGAYEIDKKLADFLENALKKTHEVVYPKMPNESEPDYKLWAAMFDQELKKIKYPLILAGHSVGGFLLLRYLIEKKIDQNVRGIFFIAIPFVGDGGWQFEGSLKNNFASELAKVPLFFYQSDNDEVVPPAHLDLYAEKVRQATVRKIIGRGHQLNNNLSEVVNDIRSLK